MITRAFLIVLAVLAAPAWVRAQAQNYTVIEITTNGTPTPGSNATATNLNRLGQVVGSTNQSNPTALVWLTPTTATALPPLVAGGESIANAINASGQIVGGSGPDNLHAHAVMWQGNTVTDLGLLPGFRGSSATAVNAAGVAAGFSTSATAVDVEDNPVSHAMLYSGGSVTDLGTLGGSTSFASGINSSGQVSGSSNIAGDGNQPTHAALWIGNVASDLGTLGGANSSGAGINDGGVVVGEAETSGLNSDNAPIAHAAMWKDGAIVDLGVLGTGVVSQAFGINNAGDIVGDSLTTSNVFDPFNVFHAVLWSHGQIIDLNSKLPAALQVQVLLEMAPAIADDGSILVMGANAADVSQGCCSRTFILKPVAPLAVSCPVGSGQTSTPYQSAAIGSGGVPPYTYSVAGALPTGLALNSVSGSVTGTPSAAGTFKFNIQLIDSGGSTPASQACSIVVAARANFSLAASPGSLELKAGGSGSVTVSQTPSGGFAGNVSLKLSGVPRGATASLTPASIGGTRSSTLTIHSRDAVAGSYAIVVTGTSGSLSNTLTITLKITADAALTVNPSSLSFGDVRRFGLKVKEVEITNDGSTQAQIGRPVIQGDAQGRQSFIPVSLCGRFLQPRQSCRIAVVFFGERVGHVSAILQIPDEPRSPLRVSLSGEVARRD